MNLRKVAHISYCVLVVCIFASAQMAFAARATGNIPAHQSSQFFFETPEVDTSYSAPVTSGTPANTANASCSDSSRFSNRITAGPTVYYNPILGQETVNCPGIKINGSSRVNVIIRNNGTVVRNCAKIQFELNMQGSATVMNKDNQPTKVYKHQAKNKFVTEGPDKCPAGYGTVDRARGNASICLNPFKTLAAHVGNGYKAGDVVFVPKTKNMKYPEYHGQPKEQWAIHDGHWVIGDVGSAIKGARLDFFAGFMEWTNRDNPLSKLGLGNKRQKIELCKANPEHANNVRNQLGYPGLAANTRTAILTATSTRHISNVQTANVNSSSSSVEL